MLNRKYKQQLEMLEELEEISINLKKTLINEMKNLCFK